MTLNMFNQIVDGMFNRLGMSSAAIGEAKAAMIVDPMRIEGTTDYCECKDMVREIVGRALAAIGIHGPEDVR